MINKVDMMKRLDKQKIKQKFKLKYSQNLGFKIITNRSFGDRNKVRTIRKLIR